MSRVSPGRFALLSTFVFVVIAAPLAPRVARAETVNADSVAAAVADSTLAARKKVSTNGPVTVYEESYPGEGIEGFYWTFDKAAELVRLLDKTQRDKPLDPLRDLFGFDIVLPDTIRALQDSVRAVADSILAVTIDVGTGFDPRYRSSYVEQKDDFRLSHDFDTSYLLTRAASINLVASDGNTFNESTRKFTHDRTLTPSFTFRFNDDVNSSLSMSRSDSRQERLASAPGESDLVENDADNTSVTARIQGRRAENRLRGILLGDVDAGIGLSGNKRNYNTPVSRGSQEQVSPNWNLKIARPHDAGRFSLDYAGDLGRARSSETRFADSLDVGPPPTRDLNFSNRFNGTLDQTVAPSTELRLTGGLSRQRFQYISQVDSLRGRQETRNQTSDQLDASLTSTPMEKLTVKGNAGISRSGSDYDLERRLFSRVVSRSADSEVNYEPWEGGKVIAKFERTAEDRDYLNLQAGQVKARKASFDYTQRITRNVNLDAGYFVKLDSFFFDDFDGNKGDRDLLYERANFVVRYTPIAPLNTSLRMETRQNQSVNIHPSKSADNKTDETYVIEPTYTLRVGKASFDGGFTADATYSVYDFKEASNFLVRRFATRQKWQQAITDRLSTETIFTYDLNDEGSYTRSSSATGRLFARSRETRRHKESLEVRYQPRRWLRTNVLYRQDSDEQFSIQSGGKKTQTTERDVYELGCGINVKRRLFKHVSLDLDYALTQKRGDRISELEKRFYNVRASIEYQPFAKKASDEGTVE